MAQKTHFCQDSLSPHPSLSLSALKLLVTGEMTLVSRLQLAHLLPVYRSFPSPFLYSFSTLSNNLKYRFFFASHLTPLLELSLQLFQGSGSSISVCLSTPSHLQLFSTANADFTMVSKVLPFLRDCMTGVNGQSLATLPTPFAELILDVTNGKERSGVSGIDLEALGIASPPKTVDSQSLQREVFRSGPFYAQWFARWQNGEHVRTTENRAAHAQRAEGGFTVQADSVNGPSESESLGRV
jgi:hypothetical protein